MSLPVVTRNLWNYHFGIFEIWKTFLNVLVVEILIYVIQNLYAKTSVKNTVLAEQDILSNAN